MRRYFPVATALVLIIAAGVGHGLATNRWGAADPGPGTGNVAGVPEVVGPWVGRELATDPQQLARGNILAACSRRYENRVTGASLQMLLVFGPTGPITVHTPDLCYPGAGYEIVGVPAGTSLPSAGGVSGEFRTAKARKEEPGRVTYLRLLWAWNAAAGWEAPEYPRLALSHSPMLYKLYVVQEMVTPDQPLLNEECTDFLQRFLPLLPPVLFRGGSSPPQRQ